MFIVEYENATGQVNRLSTIFPTVEDAREVCESLWQSYVGTDRYARFSVINYQTQQVVDDLEC